MIIKCQVNFDDHSLGNNCLIKMHFIIPRGKKFKLIISLRMESLIVWIKFLFSWVFISIFAILCIFTLLHLKS